MSASFSTWLSVGVGSRGTRRVDSTRALPCQEVSDADCRGNWKRPRLQAGEDLVNRGEQLRTPRAAAVAAATCGLAGQVHSAKGWTFTIGRWSRILAAWTPPHRARFWGSTARAEGAVPNVHWRMAL